MVLRPALEGAGIVFKRIDLCGAPRVRLRDALFSDGEARRTTIGAGPAAVQTVEHFLAALWALEIDNLEVDIKGQELPAMDGSALGFLEPLKEAGIAEQTEARKVIKVTEPERVEEGNSSLSLIPDDSFNVSYFIDYDVPSIGRKKFEIDLDHDSFEKEIAPARTFCLKKEAEALLASGLGQGATLENTLVMGDDGPVGTTLRFPDEPVRHKILDLVGDLYMLGRPVIAKVVAERSGHSLNSQMIKLLYEKYVKE